MNKANDVKNPYEIPRVVLSSIADEIQLDENLEPPFVRVRDTNSQYIQLDTSKHDAFVNPAQLIITLDRSLPRVNRIQMSFFAFKSFTPNINPRNNVFTFVRNGVPFTATITPDVDLVGILRYNALVAAMNTAVGVPGEFTVTVNPTYPNSYNITNTAANNWRFTYLGNGIVHGRFLWGFNERNYNAGTDKVEHVLTSYTEAYSRYIDVTSYELTQYTKIDTAGTKVPAETLFRFFLTDVTYGQSVFTGFSDAPSLNYDRSRNISTVDMTFLDEFGELFYIPEQIWGSFVVYVVLIASM